jgi:hypothetical protein
VLIPDLLPVLRTWQDAWTGKNVRYCAEIGEEAYRWLQEFEDPSTVGSRKDHRDPFGLRFDYHEQADLEKSIRQLFLTSASDVLELARAYLASIGKNDHRDREVRQEVIACCAQLVRHLPKELVDFILAAFLEFPDDSDHPLGSTHLSMSQELGIAGHDAFSPASPLQMPFLALLRNHEAEGLRLVRGICNHSVAVWRWWRSHPFHYAPATPVPVTLRFPWGEQKFWGDGQVYLWYRGLWGNPASRSALMAQEQWALERLDAGDDFSEIFRKCVEDHHSVGALGLAVSLCLAHAPKSIACAFPLVTCPSVWQWDVARRVQDQRGFRSNEMGDWHRHRHLLQGVRDLNAKPHRPLDVRSLVLRFVARPEETLAKRYAKAIRRFPKALPFEYEEQQQDPEFVAQLRDRMTFFVEQGDPKYWKQRPSADGRHLELHHEPPSLNEERVVAKQNEIALLDKAAGLALWGQKTLETGAVDDRLTLTVALALARDLDAPDLFDVHVGSESLTLTHRASGVAAAAYALARHSAAAEWTDDVAQWCVDVLHRAATIVETGGDFAYRGSLTLMHPCVFAAHGYSALLARGHDVRSAQSALINLAVDALDDVVKAVFVASKQYAAAYPAFLRILVVLGLKQCVSSSDDLPNHNSVHWDEVEAAQKSELIAWAEKALDTGTVLEFPRVPMPWVKDGTTRLRKGKAVEYVRSDVLFRFDLAEKVLFEIDLGAVLDSASREEFLALVSNLVDWTIQEILPPWVNRRTDNRHTNPPFKWIYAFSAWCGKLCARLTAGEANSHVLGRIFLLENDTALMMLQSIMRLFVIYAFIKPESIDPDHFVLWQQITDWLFENSAWQHSKEGDYLVREFQSCALAALFCAHNDIGPVLCAIDEGWPHLPMFMPILEKAVREFGQNPTLFYVVLTLLKRGGFDLLPDPALDWLLQLANVKKGDQTFWEANGSETVELLRQLIERRRQALSSDHRAALAAIADIIVDNGIRGAGFLQQELLREAG